MKRDIIGTDSFMLWPEEVVAGEVTIKSCSFGKSSTAIAFYVFNGKGLSL